ncbi:hypothetical protein ASD60_02990 [Pseudomonas sp. Root562]|nr:hypothetical protein ASD60_02990 [Pseudomonas sp. Root562]
MSIFSRGISEIDRIARAIDIDIHPALTKRTQPIRTVKPHKHRVIDPMAVTQVIPTGWTFFKLPVEAQMRTGLTHAALQAIGGIDKGIGAPAVQLGENALLEVAGEQQGTGVQRISCCRGFYTSSLAGDGH